MTDDKGKELGMPQTFRRLKHDGYFNIPNSQLEAILDHLKHFV